MHRRGDGVRTRRRRPRNGRYQRCGDRHDEQQAGFWTFTDAMRVKASKNSHGQPVTVGLGAPLISPHVSCTPAAPTNALSPGCSAVDAVHRPLTNEAVTCCTAPDARTTVTTADATDDVDAHGRNEHVLQTSVRWSSAMNLGAAVDVYVRG